MGKATRERETGGMGVRVTGKREKGKMRGGIIMLPSLLFFCKCGHFMQSDSNTNFRAFGSSCVWWWVQNCREHCLSSLLLPATVMFCRWSQ